MVYGEFPCCLVGGRFDSVGAIVCLVLCLRDRYGAINQPVHVCIWELGFIFQRRWSPGWSNAEEIIFIDKRQSSAFLLVWHPYWFKQQTSLASMCVVISWLCHRPRRAECQHMCVFTVHVDDGAINHFYCELMMLSQRFQQRLDPSGNNLASDITPLRGEGQKCVSVR
jgi:hypothetical protein